jgi:adenylate cyclase
LHPGRHAYAGAYGTFPIHPETGHARHVIAAQDRRLVAVLTADVAGYTRLMELQEVATHQRLTMLLQEVVEPAIAALEGQLIKYTGDGFIAAFAAPAQAVRAALRMKAELAAMAERDTAPPLLFRMGLHVTEAIFAKGDIFGTGVNLAARMQAAAEPGGLVVSAEVAALMRRDPAIRLADLGELSFKNISGITRCFAVRGVDEREAPSLPQRADDTRPSIAVMPFRQFLGGETDDYFAEGIIESIVHSLSGLDSLFVIARASTMAYAGRQADAQAIGRELGVRYVLNGSVHQAGPRLRILTELADAETGQVIRADRHDGLLADLFDIQDRISAAVVREIAPTVRRRELQRAMRKHPDSLTAYDLVLQALDLTYAFERASFDRARGLLQQAIALDPHYAPAWSHASFWHMFRIGQGWTLDVAEDAIEAARCATAAIARDRKDATALAIQGHMLSFLQKDYETAAEVLDRAVRSGPSCAIAWAMSAATCGYVGDAARAVEHAERAIRLSPLDPMAFMFEHLLSQAHYIAGNTALAVEWGRKSAANNGLLTSNLRTLAASLVAEGDADGATRVARRLLAVDPQFRLGSFAARTPLPGAVLGPFIERLRLAGLPE